ncbi:tRNA-dihydrouridine(20) synthase (NAD(+)) [Lachancea thermotolerans CBS 6340]|uniref:tRNA-dihydrouridine(20) synthase [NAD(P)+] n=1 Tax=Lachancea thermotolerans (strain ATCC 56472 / CBS 6340 / NRRL Y-8284) TaxID=559295 RepID=C5DBX2_LACTC|nr:KLTH0A06028p [Lachancea thermotolerans CBS 6340]CAR21279.1 KLTH0A06028p [Lachancea thermotolerans CBS 6340]
MVTYTGKLVLAPMVRAGELPTRLLALKYGADLVWSPEIIDKKLIQCKRQVNDKLKTIDFVAPSSNDNKPPCVVFRTFPDAERGRLIFQMGTSTPSLAVEAAMVVIKDVDGIDVNAGCPKHFSIHSGMGAALLKTPETLCSILSSLVEKVGRPHEKPISVKIRILDSEELTLNLVKKLCGTGISNLTVHCRTTPMRNRQAPIRNYVPSIYKICQANNVSLIMNGAIQSLEHFRQLRKQMDLPETIGGMMADCAEANPTVFSEAPLSWPDTARAYLDLASKFDHSVNNVKYMLSRIIPGKSKFYQYFTRCKTMEEVMYVSQQMGSDGEVLSDPTDYLAKRREHERILKQKAGDMKAKAKQKQDQTTANKDSAEAELTNSEKRREGGLEVGMGKKRAKIE